jgi:hypothetical protein
MAPDSRGNTVRSSEPGCQDHFHKYVRMPLICSQVFLYALPYRTELSSSHYLLATMLHFFLSLLALTCLTYHAQAGIINEEPIAIRTSLHNSRVRDVAQDAGHSSVASRATAAEIENARQIVKDAIAKMTVLNKARTAHPRRNQYHLKPGTKFSKRSLDSSAPPLLDITRDMASAAALLAELDAETNTNLTAPLKKRAGKFWMEGLARKGTVPWGNDSGYKVILTKCSERYTNICQKGLSKCRDRPQG